MWDETFRIKIQNPPMAVFRLAIFDEDMFGEPNFIGAATYPSTSILKGFRSVPLKNGHSEELELSTLLVKVSVFFIRGFKCKIFIIYRVIKSFLWKTEVLTLHLIFYICILIYA